MMLSVLLILSQLQTASAGWDFGGYNAFSWSDGIPSMVSYPSKRARKYMSAEAAIQHHRQLEYGDFAAYPDSCPVVTTCPFICVANETDCPTECAPGMQLCESGVCSDDCDALKGGENPCTCESLPFACAKPVDIWENCTDRFEEYYANNTACVEAQEEALPLIDFKTNPYFVACYVILGSVTGIVIVWCAFNAYMPVAGATATINVEGEAWGLVGYKYHPVGLVVYTLIMIVLFGFQFLLLILTLFYYTQQEAITLWPPVFYDEVQVLMAFEIVWMVGLPWSFAFRYPSSIRDLCLRQCSLATASFVRLHVPTKRLQTSPNDDVSNFGAGLIALVWLPFDFILRWIFSYHFVRPGYEDVMCPVETDAVTQKRAFYFRMRRFVYDTPDDIADVHHDEVPEKGQEPASTEGSFRQGTFHVGTTLKDFLAQSEGLQEDEARRRYGSAGPNTIPVKKPTVLGCILQEFSKSFYLYQNFMVWTWAPYWNFHLCITNTIVRGLGGVIVGVFQYLGDSVLYQLSHVEGNITVLRDGLQVDIPNASLVPGDVVVLKPGIVTCDMVIVTAGRLVVDESALTGEATPVVKKAIDPTMSADVYDHHLHKTCTLFAGTTISEVGKEEGKDLGLVLATGSFTTKGMLVTEVLSYQRHKFKFDDEVLIVLCILAVEALVLVGMVFFFIRGEQWVYAWFYAVYVLGTVLPPLLPTVFVVSVGISARRLQAKRITCSYQEGILIAGKVNAAFFDKTGTLTIQGLELVNIQASSAESNERATLGMAVCHTLYLTSQGQLVGNHVDMVSFRKSCGEFSQESGSSSIIKYGGQNFEVVKQFEFDSHRATQSVVVRDSSGKLTVFVKGSPEAIYKLCISGGSSDFDDYLKKLMKMGIYMLAIASKELDLGSKNLDDIARDDVEANLHFDAFLCFQNSMRENTPAVIREILEGDVTVAMITGDSVLTGIYIARQAGIIKEETVLIANVDGNEEIAWVDADRDDEVEPPTLASLNSGNVALCVAGDAWRAMLQKDPKYACLIAEHIRVFGRCNPSDKVSVIAHFVAQGRKTLMCGDGGNDCGSLKTAHVGIALSRSEASVVAPFTSLDMEITSVTEVLREGRCALASTFAAYSYYIIYGQTESFLQVIHSYFATTFTEWCWVFLDGFWSILMAFSLPLARAANKLSPTRPTASILGPHTLASVCGILAWNFIFLVIALAVLWNEDWFQCRMWSSEDVSDVRSIGDNYETTVLFLVGGFQYVSSAIALNFGYAWRQNFWRNYVFVLLAGVFTVMLFIATLYPSTFSCIWRVNCDNENAVRFITSTEPYAISNFWNTTLMPTDFRWKIAGIMASNLVAICLWQYFFVNGFLSKMYARKKMVSNYHAVEANAEKSEAVA